MNLSKDIAGLHDLEQPETVKLSGTIVKITWIPISFFKYVGFPASYLQLCGILGGSKYRRGLVLHVMDHLL